ncbi:T9SS type A sorting domain-containing protein, partial [Flavihumibacter sediminis]|nr:T9SS type A sorting domain-containing protein [Flavihumibacter sediminis]
NPVDNVLIVRSEQPLDLILSDGNGKVRINLKLQAGLQTVDVSSLDKGLYIITLTQAESGRKITEKLIKN